MSVANDHNAFSYDDPRFRITPLQQMGAACSGAFVASLIMTPLDVVKIRLQAQEKAILSSKARIHNNGIICHLHPCFNGCHTCSPQANIWLRPSGHLNGTLDAFMKISRKEGISSLWSGLSPTLILALPATVIYYVAYEQLRVRLKDYYNKNWNQGKNPVQPTWIPLIAGASARVWAATIVSPLELIRTKMQSKKLSYSQIIEAIKNVLRQQGISGLWKGLGPTLMRDVPFSAIYWLHYEGIKNAFSQQCPSFAFSFYAGAVSGSVAGIVTLPFDVVKTHQQIELGDVQRKGENQKRPRLGPSSLENGRRSRRRRGTTADIMRHIYNETGYKGLFTGFVPRIVKVAPACAIMVASFEYGKNFFQNYNKQVFLNSKNSNTWGKTQERAKLLSFDLKQ